jgi:PhnB protein
MYVPEGYGTVFPYMIVDGADDFSNFLSAVFGAIGMPPMPGSYYAYVEDVDDTFATALAHGARKIFEPSDMPYQDRQAGVSDPFGNIWWISKRLVEQPYD